MTVSAISGKIMRPLREYLAERGPLPPSEALSIVRAVAEIVRSGHARGLLHGAIEVAAVHLTATGEPRLEDGPSVRTKEAPRPPELRSFRLPLPVRIEEASAALARAGIALDPRRIDVYQLGALLCHLLCGEDPAAYLRSPRYKAKVPPPLRSLLDHALGHNPRERFVTVEQLLSAVETNALNGEARTTPYLEPPSALPLSDKDPLPFARLGPYTIHARIGRGGMGEVYKGHDPRLDRTVAIKVLPDVFSRFPEMVERFYAEAGAAARLVHPNIIPIYFIGEEAGCHFFAMQYIEGESLAERLARRKRLSVEEALAIGEQCAAGLAAAHRAGLVHRDIKPGNILIHRHTGRALLADFGLVKVLDAQTKATATGMVLGTIDYIAPEQARGLSVDGRADLYALGVVLYEALSGRLPFRPAAAAARLFQHAFETPIPLRHLVPEVPVPLAALVDRLLAKQPEQRAASVEILLAELRALRSGDSVSAVIRAPMFGPPPSLSLAQAPHRGWKQILWDGARSLLRRQAPEVLACLQNTQQQVDGAVAEYERRRDQLAAWLGEARTVADELGEQARARRGLVTDPDTNEEERKDTEELAAELERQQAEQREHVAEMELQLSRVETMLRQLRAQRDALNARLRLAEARAVLAGDRSRIRPVIAAPLLLLVLVASGYIARSVVPSSDPSANTQEAETTAPSAPSEETLQEAADEPEPAGPLRGVCNSIGMRFACIPSGRFEMGNHEPLAAADPQAARDAEDQYPLHEVFLSKDFWMGVTEVTQEQFERVMGYNPNSIVTRIGHSTAAHNTWRFPVTNVTWYDARKFCRELSNLPKERQASRRYRLPTEAEWEYACHGPGERKTRYAFGDDDKQLPLYAFLRGNRAPWNAEVAGRKPNAFGLYDMYGNVEEWCLDRYTPDYYTKLASELAVDPAGPRTGIHRVIRGGGPSYRSSARGHLQPNMRGGGFRVLFGGANINDP